MGGERPVGNRGGGRGPLFNVLTPPFRHITLQKGAYLPTTGASFPPYGYGPKGGGAVSLIANPTHSPMYSTGLCMIYILYSICMYVYRYMMAYAYAYR